MGARSIPRAMVPLAALGLALLAAPATLAEDREARIAVIVSADWESLSKMSLHELRKIYLRHSSTFSGVRVTPLDQPSGSEIQQAFLRKVVAMPRRRLEDYWLEQALTGGRRPPRQIGADVEIVNFVARNVGAIGYVDVATLQKIGRGGVRVLAVHHEGQSLKPSDPGYPLTYRGN